MGSEGRRQWWAGKRKEDISVVNDTMFKTKTIKANLQDWVETFAKEMNFNNSEQNIFLEAFDTLRACRSGGCLTFLTVSHFQPGRVEGRFSLPHNRV